jgi:hypothetical protein
MYIIYYTALSVPQTLQGECSVPSKILYYPAQHNLLKSLMLLLFQALGMEISSTAMCAMH